MQEREFVFSIIIPVYNVEEYIEEAIESIINQSFDFEDVQLIIVNDGSTDGSKDICLKYAEEYSNIEYYEKENGGLPSARNYGLDYVKGKYVNFMDADDTISEFALEKINEFFADNNDINLVGLVVKYFGAKKGIHPRYSKFEKETVIVDLEEAPQNYILSSAATFYKANLFNNLRFSTNLLIAEDVFFNCQIYLENNMFGIISSEEAVYNYRKRPNNSSLTGRNKHDADTFIYVIDFLYTKFKEILKEKNMEMPSFLKYILIGEITKRQKSLNKLAPEKLSKFHDVCKKILQDIEPEIIRKFYMSNHMMKVALYALKYDLNPENIEYKIIDSRLYANGLKIGFPTVYPLILSKLDVKNDKIIIEGVYNDIIPVNKATKIRFKDSNLDVYNMSIEKTDNKFYESKYLGILFNEAYRVKCEIPLKNGVYIPYIKIAGMDTKMEFKTFLKFNLYSNYVDSNEPFKLFRGKKEIIIDNGSIEIKNTNGISKRMYKIDRKKYIDKMYPELENYRKYAKKNKKYILINDRPMIANDNGQALFEYINKYKKDYAMNTYFVISKNSPSYNKLKKIGNVVDIGSKKHKKLFLNSKLIISSHANFYNPFTEQETKLYKDILDYKFVFLQHGVVINDVHKPINKAKAGIDMFVTSTEKEREEILTPKYMYNEEEVVLTGLPRFDKLVNKNEKLIVISPTWRTFLSGPINKEGFHDPIDGFENSEYYEKWSKVLGNKKVLKKCKENGYKILFVLHPGFRNYYRFFDKFNNDIMEVKHSEDIIYSDMFNKLSLLITDYSSIMFDVAYLKKPTIFYQFDKDMYFSKHYKPGYFSYDENGFGEVITDEKRIIDKIMYYFDNEFKLEEKYITNIENTFKYIDKNNSRRVFENILKLMKNNKK